MIYHKPFCYCNLGRQECFVNNCGKRWLYLKVLEKSQKPPKFGTQESVRKNSVVYHIVHATLINCKSSNFLKQCVVFAVKGWLVLVIKIMLDGWMVVIGSRLMMHGPPKY